MNLFDRLLLPENLYFAWQKAKRLYQSSDGYIDRGEISEFELHLEARLAALRQQFESGHYRTSKLRPLPRPKKLEGGQPIDRQYFHVSVEDQVAWIAVVNALGPILDQKMPSWSYGNRLYRPAWYEPDEEKSSRLEIGPYRHSSGHLYRKFQHSWPLFRRHVSLTARVMATRMPLRRNEMDETDQHALAAAETEKLRYLIEGYWQTSARKEKDDLYYASIDLKQFYPQLNVELILAGLAEADPEGNELVRAILSGMMKFRVDHSGVPPETIKNVEPQFLKKKVKGLPTGLFVSGFLANIAMRKVDGLVDQELDKNKSIAHFRFVDDHTILTHDFGQLCDWIKWYEDLLIEQNLGPKINTEKFDPLSLGQWVAAIKKGKPTSPSAQKQYNGKRTTASDETKVDGKNPTKLMTKTLTQVSAIAAADIHILDDEDLQERLKMLEWLLLADIPEREIRPDTRAAFAAGQIAQLAPVLIQEADGLLDTARKLANLRANPPDPQRSTSEERESYQTSLNQLEAKVHELSEEHENTETNFLRRCFRLLIGSFQEFPGKSRLLFRVLQYCRITGFKGLSDVSSWLQDLRNDGNLVWANYFSGLCLQILGQNAIACAKSLTQLGTLRSDQSAAVSHLEDLIELDLRSFQVNRKAEPWFNSVARIEFGVSMLVAAKTIEKTSDLKEIATCLEAIARTCTTVSTDASHEDGNLNTGRSPGVWAFQYEVSFGARENPSAAWEMFSSQFRMLNQHDKIAVRWYPEEVSDEAWDHFLTSKTTLPPSESGWVVEAIDDREHRRSSALTSGKEAFTRAAKSARGLSNQITLQEWATILSDLNPFDPRVGEWTALEIMRQLIDPITEISGDEELLDRLHPHNVVLPITWLRDSSDIDAESPRTWGQWRQFLESKDAGKARFRGTPSSISDYRFVGKQNVNMAIHSWDRRAAAVGFLLLGLLRKSFKVPRIWNIRGHENVLKIPRTQWYQSLAISSPTLLLIEGCVSARTSETRTIPRAPDLFGYLEGRLANDTNYDPPSLQGVNELLEAIKKAQSILAENQLSVSLNQPRQLIPFRIRDFGTGSVHGDVEDDATVLE